MPNARLLSRNTKHLLLTFDAFGTLYVPRQPIAKTYADVARDHGLTGFSVEEVDSNFRRAFKAERERHPNYGKQAGLRAQTWWANVIESTFAGFNFPKRHLKTLAQTLSARFDSSTDYTIYPDVLPFFSYLRSGRKNGITVGIVTNSDDRVPSILSSLGLSVRHLKHGDDPFPSKSPVDSGDDKDIDFITMSYDVGSEKPKREIFDAARLLGCGDYSEGLTCIHVGDSLKEDVEGARQAGWQAILLDRSATGLSSPEFDAQGVYSVSSLMHLKDILFESTT